ncbi:MAG: flagellar biosynthetic protein FliO [Pseudomonadota bacterium]
MRSLTTVLVASLVIAPAQAQQAAGATMTQGAGLLPLMLNLLLVLGIILLLGWFFARSKKFGSSQHGALEVVATRMVGNRERLVVVQVGDEQVLLGITASHITPLHTLNEPLATSTTQTPIAGGFAAKLKAFRDPHGVADKSQS